MGSKIHPLAIVESDVEFGDGCVVGPFAIVESGARLGGDNEIGSGAYIFGGTEMGSRNRVMRAASLGGEPQSRAYGGEKTRLVIGDDNWFGENLTVHRGTAATGKTVLGNDNFLMANTHVGHDCRLGNEVIMANDAKLGGFAELHDGVNLGAGVGVHQYTRVGKLALAAALARVNRDTLPFTVSRQDDTLFGLNRVGIERANYRLKETETVKKAYRMFCQQRKPLQGVLQWMEAQPPDPFLETWIAFLSEPSKNGYARARTSKRSA